MVPTCSGLVHTHTMLLSGTFLHVPFCSTHGTFCIICLFIGMQFDAVTGAQVKSCAVQHPLLDRVRQCSARPDVAADFFTLVFMPNPEQRGTNDLNEHPYLAEVWAKLEAATANQDEPGKQWHILKACVHV